MDIDNLFKALPRDLQWEILSEFVGTHVVRNGKLMRKLGNKIKEQLKATSAGYFKELWLKPCLIHCFPSAYLQFNTYMLACVWFHSGNLLKICEDTNTHEISYVYSNPFHQVNETPQKPIISVLDDSVVLPPFIKHEYPSYEYTDKKKRLISYKLSALNAMFNI
jgi:hypothetical protein